MDHSIDLSELEDHEAQQLTQDKKQQPSAENSYNLPNSY